MPEIQLKFDAVVMLTWSNWFTELRSNRYHYALRFAKYYPVIFVQPDRDTRGYAIEASEIENVVILHVSSLPGKEQKNTLNHVLKKKNIVKPLFWVYNVNFSYYLLKQKEKMVVYHATENYFLDRSPIGFKKGDRLYRWLVAVLEMTDLLVSVSEGVQQSYLEQGRYIGRSMVVTNGCDDIFYGQMPKGFQQKNRKTVFYQGNIYNKLDFKLLIELVNSLPDWTFFFCGPVLCDNSEWQRLLLLHNVNYLGVLTPEALRDAAHEATVGIIPFKRCEFLKISWPLKAFEYVACGLPVVSTPIDALQPYTRLFSFAETADAFRLAIEAAASKRYDEVLLAERKEMAHEQGYNQKFDNFYQVLQEHIVTKKQPDYLNSALIRSLKQDLRQDLRQKIKSRIRGLLRQ